jgi:hypothetical protein
MTSSMVAWRRICRPSDAAPTCITLNQVYRSHQCRHRYNSREGHEAGDWGRQLRARELAFVAQWEEKEMEGKALTGAHGPRGGSGVSTSWGHGMGNDKAALTEGMMALLKGAQHGPRGGSGVSTSWGHARDRERQSHLNGRKGLDRGTRAEGWVGGVDSSMWTRRTQGWVGGVNSMWTRRTQGWVGGVDSSGWTC